jgi:SAM-dependent methyltransferase
MDVREARRRGQTGVRHPWERARLAHVRALLRDAFGDASGDNAGDNAGDAFVERPISIVDVGAGDAFVARALSDDGYSVCAIDTAWSESDLTALAIAAPTLQTSTSLPAPGSAVHADSADVALLLDVIEHVDDDVALLRRVASVVRPRGLLIITVPAWPQLMSRHDDVLGHRRRYTPESFRAALAQVPLDIETWGGCFHALLAPRALTVWRERGTRTGRGSGDGNVTGVHDFAAPRVVGDAITAALRAELWLSRTFARKRHAVPFIPFVPGLSLYAVARTP